MVFTLMYRGRPVSDSVMLDLPIRSDFSMESPFERAVGKVVLRWDIGMMVVLSEKNRKVEKIGKTQKKSSFEVRT